MNDLISRKTVIDAVNRLSLGETDAVRLSMRIEDYLNRIPPAQPTFDARDTQYNLPIGTDLISRQAALDALNHELRCGAVINQCGLEMAYEVIEGLPPAEPKRETTTLRIGRTRNGVTMWYECEKCGEPVNQEDAFCRRCGRGIIHE